MTQTQAILAQLRAGGSITPGEALDWFGCFRLAARIADARALLLPEEEIVNVGWTTATGKHVARYTLRRTSPAQLGLFA